MEKKEDGGLAFACEYMVKTFTESRHHADEDKERLLSNVAGMTLRDYFAAKAMQKYSPRPSDETNIGWTSIDFSEAARLSYAYADAMLKARKS